jgi:hypothetical protein
MSIRSSVIAVSRNAVLNVFPIILWSYLIGCYAEWGDACVPVWGKIEVGKGTPFPRSLRIIELAAKLKKIYAAQ